jgi:DNA-formamidopyrimidine glycosylase
MHLGMSGRFIVEAPGTPPVEPGAYYNEIGRHLRHDHVVFHMESGARVTYNDVRRFGFMDLVPRAELASSRHFAGMGIEPLGNELSGETLAKLFSGKFAPLKAALLDQRLVAGLGNIYVCEALFRAGLHPEAEAGSIATATGRPRPAAHALAQIIRDVLEEAVAAGGSTLRDFAHADGSLGYFQHRFRVYDREGEALRHCRLRRKRQAAGTIGPLDLLLRELSAEAVAPPAVHFQNTSSSRTSGKAALIRDPGTPADVVVLDPGSPLRCARDDGAFITAMCTLGRLRPPSARRRSSNGCQSGPAACRSAAPRRFLPSAS